MKRLPLKNAGRRLALLLLLTFGASFVLLAQAGAEAKKEEKSEPGIGWKWANFAILAAGLGYLIAKTAPALFRARTTAIQKDIAEAQAVKKDAESRAAAVDARVQALGAEMDRFRAQSKIEMREEGERIRQETAHQIARLDAQFAQEVESAGKVARRELKEYAAKLALDLAEQRIRVGANAATESGLVDAFVADLGHRESKN
jgi:F-type H+-transporting ATPase subunit b